MLSLVILVLYLLVIRCYQIAWRAILTNTNKRQTQEMALEGMLEWVVLHRRFNTSVFMYSIPVQTVPIEIQTALFRVYTIYSPI